MASTIINVSFYSLRPLPMEIRKSFELPEWPYSRSDGQMPDELAEYFRRYSIFYYRDEITKGNQLREGLITPGISVETPVDCYSHSCYIDYGGRTFKIVPWWSQCSRQFVQDCINLTGDDLAWTVFNEHRICKGFNSRYIKAPLVAKLKPSRDIRQAEDLGA